MTQDRWADLPLRMASAMVLLLIFSASLYFGRIGVLALGLVAVVAMQWELARMFGLKRPPLAGGALVAGLGWLPMAVQPTDFDPEFASSSRGRISSNHAGSGVYRA